jgi:XapX domain-containing protein
MMVVAQAIGVGLAVGALVRWCSLPVPAPPTVAGCACVCGLALGYFLAGLY